MEVTPHGGKKEETGNSAKKCSLQGRQGSRPERGWLLLVPLVAATVAAPSFLLPAPGLFLAGSSLFQEFSDSLS